MQARLREALRPVVSPTPQLGPAATPDDPLPWNRVTAPSPLMADALPSAATSPPAFVFQPNPNPPHQQPSLWQPAPRGYAALRVLGQVFDGYLVCEGDGRVVLIDQHAAHERVAFERLRLEHQAGGVARDTLLVPETIELAPAEVATLADHGAVVLGAGFEGEAFGDRTYLVRSTPRLLRGQDVGRLLRAVAAELNEEGATSAAQAAIDHVLATIACHSVVRVGQRLDDVEIRALLVAMDGVDVNAHCPHGRPVSVDLTRAQVETLFRR